MTTTAYDKATTRWTIDPDETQVEFDVKSFWGLANVHGHFDRFTGSYETGPDGVRIELTADADSLDTGNNTRDKHLRSPHFFHVAEHPQIHFLSTSVHDTGNGSLEVIGRLGTAGRATSLKFPATLRRVGDELEVEATTTVDQSELGMSTGTLGMIRRPATLHVKARLRETPVSEGAVGV